MITKTELIEVLDMYFTPIFQIAGAICAIFVLALACFIVIRPFVRRV